MSRLAAAALAGAALLVGAGSAPVSASSSAQAGRAQSYAVRILLPDQTTAGTPTVSAPPDTVSLEGGFVHPADGSIVSTASATGSASTGRSNGVSARASSEVTELSLFAGEITASRVTGRARASAGPRGSSGDVRGAGVIGLNVFGAPASGSRIPLADWGYAEVLRRTLAPAQARRRNAFRAAVTALVVRLTADHGGLPAGSEIVIGYADATAEATVPAPAPRRAAQPTPTPPPAGPASRVRRPGARAGKHVRQPREPRPPPFAAPPVRPAPPKITPRLTAGGYVFPVYGPSYFSDTFGAPRAAVGWHHGADIFAPLGAPVLAVTRGTVFSVGWNDIGGNRLWLRDDEGNEFYYAHLSAFSPLAVNGARVKAGEVLGFVGNTGDATGTPYHLHFEIHPVELLGRGYDGAVNPTGYLEAWRRLEDLSFAAARVPGWRGWTGVAPVASPIGRAAPKPGAILLQISDISGASGLEPGALRQALALSARAEMTGGLVRAPGVSGL